MRLGPFEIRELVVRGGFSVVYRGRDVLLGRPVAIKVFHLSPEKEQSLPYDHEQWRNRFIEEARLLARLDHPHVVRVDQLGFLADGSPFMVMPWHVANLRREIGQDVFDPTLLEQLAPVARPRRLAPARAIHILRQICLGLAALHRRGIVHRDVKPSNVLLTARQDGDVRLCDLGMARNRRQSSQSRAGLWIGTYDYCAPEQRQNAAAVTDRADIYSLGVLAYRLLSGVLPVGAFIPVSALGTGIPDALDAWIADALAPDPTARPAAIRMAARLVELDTGPVSESVLR